jgi:hypothetical protein
MCSWTNTINNGKSNGWPQLVNEFRKILLNSVCGALVKEFKYSKNILNLKV